jgi:hypothetical protein
MPALITAHTASHDGSFAGTTILFCVSILFMFLLHPRLGIRDVDGYAYIMGARSLHQGTGYRSLTGEALNHWPPGYSLLLSAFRNPVPAALVLNYLSFGAAVSLLYYLFLRVGWTWQAGLGFSVTLGSGFFRLLANMAHADMLTYALFLAAICFAIQRPSRTLPGLIWASLVPLKYIAIIFLPPSIAADMISGRQDWKSLLRSYIPAVIATALSIISIIAFNFLTIRMLFSSSHLASSVTVLELGVKSFIVSIPRSFCSTGMEH